MPTMNRIVPAANRKPKNRSKIFIDNILGNILGNSPGHTPPRRGGRRRRAD
jgi:hypothetical protein